MSPMRMALASIGLLVLLRYATPLAMDMMAPPAQPLPSCFAVSSDFTPDELRSVGAGVSAIESAFLGGRHQALRVASGDAATLAKADHAGCALILPSQEKAQRVSNIGMAISGSGGKTVVLRLRREDLDEFGMVSLYGHAAWRDVEIPPDYRFFFALLFDSTGIHELRVFVVLLFGAGMDLLTLAFGLLMVGSGVPARD